MSSPEVYDDARAIIEAAALSLNLPVAWPNEEFLEPQPFDNEGVPSVWVAVELEGDVGDPVEIGGVQWDEQGVVHLSVMIPLNTGVREGMAKRKALALAFRGLPPGVVLYGSSSLDPGGPSETDGRWRMLGLRVAYSFQDRVELKETRP